MSKSVVLIILTVFHIQGGTRAVESDRDCEVGTGKSGSLNLSIQSQRNRSGEWVTTFTTSRHSEDSTNIIKLDLNQTVVDCGGKKLVQVHGILRDTPVNLGCAEWFLFHPNVAKNVVITNNRKTIHRKNPDSENLYATALTHRPMNREELFEVQIDRNITKWSDNIVIGVTTHLPGSIVFSSWMDNTKSDTWMMFKFEVRQNGSKIKSYYGRDSRTLQAGDRVGVVIRNNNTLHFFVNGMDQGAAAINIPNNIYAFVEVMGNAVQATIIDKCP